jgi:predicted alpha-1,6-mannanase (GH76 family)
VRNLWTKGWPVDSVWRMSGLVSTVAAMSMGMVTPWSGRAEQAQRVLIDRYWDRRRRLFRVTARRGLPGARWHYWWQAHALDACIDAAVRTESADVRRRVADLVGGIVQRNGGHVLNDYYDDMAWMGLALLRADQIGAVNAGPLVGRLWTEIRGGWDGRHGGIVFRRGDTYTNTPANGPAAMLAARLHQHAGAADDLRWARRIVDWLHDTLVDRETGIVWDGVHPESGGPPSRELYTYNQGVVVGADVELYRSTGDDTYLRRAERTAGAALTRLADPATGLLPAEGDGDGGLFKGILARNLGEFVAAVGRRAAGGAGAAVFAALHRNGTGVGEAAGTGPVGPDWSRPAAGAGSLSTHLSAVLLLETLARLDTLLPEEVARPPPPAERRPAECLVAGMGTGRASAPGLTECGGNPAHCALTPNNSTHLSRLEHRGQDRHRRTRNLDPTRAVALRRAGRPAARHRRVAGQGEDDLRLPRSGLRGRVEHRPHSRPAAQRGRRPGQVQG